MLWDYCKFTIASPGLFSDALHLHTSANKRFLYLPALLSLGHRGEEGWVQEKQPSTLMMLQPDSSCVHLDTGAEAGNSHSESKLVESSSCSQKWQNKSSIKVEQVVLVDCRQKWLELLNWSSDPKNHEICGPWIPSAGPHAGLKHLKAYCENFILIFFSFLETFK